jgi:hypothetical protein
MGEFAFRGDGEDLFAHLVDAADDLHRVFGHTPYWDDLAGQTPTDPAHIG